MTKETIMRRRRINMAASVLLAMGLVASPGAEVFAAEGSSETDSSLSATAYSPLDGAQSSSDAMSAVADLVAPIDFGCPAGTTDYPGSLARFNCVVTYRDNGKTGHDPRIGVREGLATTASSFGIRKVEFVHGLTLDSVATVVVNNAFGREQENGNILYGLRQTYGAFPTGVAVEVIVQQEPSDEEAAPDDSNLGVVTAYCVGFTGQCPARINEAVAASVG